MKAAEIFRMIRTSRTSTARVLRTPEVEIVAATVVATADAEAIVGVAVDVRVAAVVVDAGDAAAVEVVTAAVVMAGTVVVAAAGTKFFSADLRRSRGSALESWSRQHRKSFYI